MEESVALDELATSSSPMIEVEDLMRDFGDTHALRGVSFTVPEGEIFGFIGPNGAGKTTTIRILSTLLEPTSGNARVGGMCVINESEEVRRILGYMPDYFGVYEGLTVYEYLEFFAGAYQVPPRLRRSTLEDVMELTDLGPLKDRMVLGFSKGMKQRLCLAKTLIHNPKLLILDEPAAGLDPRARIELRALLKELREMGKTILISSHILTELSDLCTSVGIIESGELITSGPIDVLEAASKGIVRVRIEMAARADKAVQVLAACPDIENVVLEGREIRLDYQGEPETFYRVVKQLADQELPFLSVHHEKTNLESVFMELTQGDVQ